jgi:hypothetical protein
VFQYTLFDVREEAHHPELVKRALDSSIPLGKYKVQYFLSVCDVVDLTLFFFCSELHVLDNNTPE